MKRFFAISLLLMGLCSCSGPSISMESAFSMNLCKSGHYSEVASGDLLYHGSSIGSVIAINRNSKRIKAKYFAYKSKGSSVHNRFNGFGSGKEMVSISSGAYANGFSSSNIPIGITVDDGNAVNQVVDPKMDGLVIVEATGGVRISNIEDEDLSIGTNGKYETVNIQSSLGKAKFLDWCSSERATVFQTHLLIYKNGLKFKREDSEKAVRKILVLAKQSSTGHIYHMIIYAKATPLSLYEMATNTLSMLNSAGYEVIAAANLDTGGFDILSTSTELSNCDGSVIQGGSNGKRTQMSNLLAYYVD